MEGSTVQFIYIVYIFYLSFFFLPSDTNIRMKTDTALTTLISPTFAVG